MVGRVGARYELDPPLSVDPTNKRRRDPADDPSQHSHFVTDMQGVTYAEGHGTRDGIHTRADRAR